MPRNRPAVSQVRPTRPANRRRLMVGRDKPEEPVATSHGLSKSRVCSGLQCHKKLWWEVHDEDLPERDAATEFILNQGREVGELARNHAPGGVLIDFPHDAYLERVRATRAALRNGTRRIYEASFLAEGVFCSIDILEREGPRYTAVEVKSSTKVKPEHIGDVAVQVHVARRAGVNVTRAEVMHLNRACTHPDLSDLFVREDVSPRVEAFLLDLPPELAAQFAMLAGPLPEVAIGPHCFAPRDCPFLERCWAEAPEHHVTSLYGIRSDAAWALAGDGHETILDLPPSVRLSAVAARQVRAVRSDALIVERGLGAALAKLDAPLAYLDFETVGPAVPVWPGCHPYTAVPVQFSCHVQDRRGGVAHRSWLAEGPGDPRPALAAALVAACRGAKSVLMYTRYERARIRDLADAVPALADALRDLDGRLVDLAAVVRSHVYHPDFGGSFSIKDVLPALVPELSYGGLAINDGRWASAELYRLLLKGDSMTPEERATLRADLLEYCKMDTWAMVKLLERLRELAGNGGARG